MGSPAISFDAPLKQAATVPVPAGVTFDQPLQSSTTVSVAPQDQSQAPQSIPATPQPKPTPTAPALGSISATPGSLPNDPMAARLSLWAQNVQSDLMNGTDITGVGHVLKAMGAHGLASGTSEDTAKFMGSLPLGLLRVIQGGAELPQSGKRWQGTKDVAGGALQAATIPASFMAPEGAEATATGLDRAGEAVASGAGKAVNAVRKPFSLKAVQEALQTSKDSIQQALQRNLQNVQDTWHGSVRDLFDQVAKEADAQPKPAESLRDVAANTAAAVKAKGSSLYRDIDNALGGTRFQTFDEQLSNVRRALRNDTGVDHDQTGRLIERLNDLEDAKATAIKTAIEKGIDPRDFQQASAYWRQGSALEDLSKHIQASTSGLRSELSQGLNATQEALSPAKLASRANRMYNTGRLQQAVGDGHANELLQNIEYTIKSLQDAAEKATNQTEAATAQAARQADAVKTRRLVTGAVAASAGVPTAWTWIKHLLGE